MFAGLEVRHQLADVILRLPVIRAVVDAHLGIVAVGNGLAKAQQRTALWRSSDHIGVAAARAGRVHVGLDRQVLHVVADLGRSASPPSWPDSC